MNTDNEWHDVAAATDVADGEAKQVRVAGELIAIFNLSGCFYATSDTCTHADASLCDGYIDGETIECPLHQAVFHIPTGKVLAEPARTDLRVFPIRVASGSIQVKV
jgi:nitrite reductase/ring-hydroxylating ferredoxin subunit